MAALKHSFASIRDILSTTSFREGATLEERKTLRYDRKWTYVLEPVIERMTSIVERDYALTEFQSSDSETFDQFNKLFQKILLNEPPQSLRAFARFGWESQEGAARSKIGLKSVHLDEKRDAVEVSPLDIAFTAQTDPLKDGGTRSTQTYNAGGMYMHEELVELVRRYLQVLEENDGNNYGVQQSFLAQFPNIADFSRHVFDLRHCKTYPRHGHNQHVLNDMHPVEVDMIFPFDHRTMRKVYPAMSDGLESVKVDIKFTDELRKKVALMLSVNKDHIRVRANILDSCLVWSTLHALSGSLVPCRMSDGTPETIQWNPTDNGGVCGMSVALALKLPLRIKLSLPVIHLELCGRRESESGDYKLSGKIVEMEKTTFGKTLSLVMPGLSVVLERIVATWRVETTASETPEGMMVRDVRTWEVPKFGKVLQSTYEKVIRESIRKEEERRHHTQKKRRWFRKEKEEPDDDPQLDYMLAAMLDLQRIRDEMSV